MKNSFTVAWFTINETIRKKSFVVSNIIILVFIFLFFSIIYSQFGKYSFSSAEIDKNENTISSTKSNTRKELLISDIHNYFTNSFQDIKDENYNITVNNNLSISEIKDLIINKNYDLAINITSPNSFDFIILDETTNTLSEANYIAKMLKNYYLINILSDSVNKDDLDLALSNINYNIFKVKTDGNDLSYVVGIIVSFILFLSIYLYGHSISASIASEKNSRVIETLVTSTSPKCIIIGKTMGMGILGLLQLIFIVLSTIVCYRTFIPEGIDFINIYLANNVSLSFSNIILLLIYFILGYIIFAFLNAVTGACVNKPEDIQLTNLPLSFVSMFSFYISLFTFNLTDTKLGTFAALFPLSSPFSMPSKILAGNALEGEILGSIFILIITTIILAYISIKIYSIAILHYGNRLKIKDLLKFLIFNH